MNKTILRNIIRKRLKNKAKKDYFIFNFNKFLAPYRLLYFFKVLYKNYYELQQAKTIAIYFPLYYEINCLRIAKWLTKLNIIVVLPKIINKSKVLMFYEFSKNTRVKNNVKGIKEPIGGETFIPDALIVPLIAYDSKGVRLGQGGGYYDCTIAKFRKEKNIMVIGAAYSWQQIESIPSDNWDIKLNALVTERFCKVFSK